MKVLIFGTGLSARKVLKSLIISNVDIVAFVDNDFTKHGQYFENHIIIAPKDICNLDFDYIIIAIIKYKSVNSQLIDLGISDRCILPYFDTKSIEITGITSIIKTDILLRDNYNVELHKLNNIISNMPFEIINKVDSKNYIIPIVKTIDETVDKIVKEKVSISRYGDGEIKLIAGADIGFQHSNDKLKRRLKQILKSNEPKHIVGILNVFGDLSSYIDELKTYFREYLADYDREFQYDLLDMNKVYYDAFITRPYISYIDKSKAVDEFNKIKRIWENRDVVIIEGDRTRLGIGNDLFKSVRSCKRIICPNEDAFNRYEEILETVLQIDKEKLILIALGPTATVLAYDLSVCGYQAVDIGHIDVEYEWFKMGATTKVPLKNKYTNEAFGGNASSVLCDEDYNKQIIAYISN